MSRFSSLTNNSKELLLLFTYAPAGFGHLRVTDALYHGLPDGAYALILGAQDKSIVAIHRLMSTNFLVRKISEQLEGGILEEILTAFYRFFLQRRAGLLYSQIVTILDQQLTRPSKVLIVSTHFGIAHQIAALKEKLENEKKVKIVLVVQVTDDSPRPIWYIEGADTIFVPSERTKKQLEQYGRKYHLKPLVIRVIPYPLSPRLQEKITDYQFHERIHQLTFNSLSQIHIAIPISGAAVGTQFSTDLIDELYKKSHRFIFHVITKNVLYTSGFIQQMLNRPYVDLLVSSQDKEVVDKYEEVYKQHIIALEITKPSEQAFKAILDSKRRGGSVLLFTQPIGQQEYDNVDFLKRHNLIPSNHEHSELWDFAQKNQLLDTQKHKNTHSQTTAWGGLMLPHNPFQAANFIWWGIQHGLFSTMTIHRVQPDSNDPHKYELQIDGVKQFWNQVAVLINT